MASALHSEWVSAQALWAPQQVVGSDSLPSFSLGILEVKCCLYTPLVSVVDEQMPGLSCPGQRGLELLLGNMSIS